MPPQPQIPVIAENALKDLFFEEIERGVVEFHGGKDAGRIEPSLKACVNAAEIKKRHPLINLQDVGVVDDVQAVRFVQGGRQF